MVELANSNPADRSDRGTALTPLAEVAAAPWRELAARAVEPNAYYLPEWARAVNASPRARAATLARTQAQITILVILHIIPGQRDSDRYEEI